SALILLVNPVLWTMTVVYFLSKGTLLGGIIESMFPSALYYPALLCLLGNFIFFYSQLYICVKRGFDDLARYTLLGPLYWILMSIGAWVGLISLLRNPHYWAKTEHGVSLGLAHLGQNAVSQNGMIATAASALAIPVASVTPPSRAYVAGASAGSAVSAKTLSVVLPAYNEEALIESTVRAVAEALAWWGLESEIIVVNDGS